MALALTLAVGHSPGVSAADSQGRFGIRGAGLISCATYDHERALRSKAYDVVAGWMDGYLTATNQFATRTYDAAPYQSTELYAALVEEYCKQHPAALVFAVLNSLVKFTWNERLRTPSLKVPVEVAARKTSLYEEVIRQVEQQLARRGFYRGSITSTYGTAATAAMKAYQKSIGFTPTGFPDQATLWRLLGAMH